MGSLSVQVTALSCFQNVYLSPPEKKFVFANIINVSQHALSYVLAQVIPAFTQLQEKNNFLLSTPAYLRMLLPAPPWLQGLPLYRG